MRLPSPNLDDRDFDALVEEALAVVRRNSQTWTDLSPGDPGVVLIEAFAHLTETMIYRLNRLPDKVYVALLELIGVQPHPPSAASVILTFSVEAPQKSAIKIPIGTKISSQRSNDGSESVVFETLVEGVLEAGATEIEVVAAHCRTAKGELCGVGNGQAGQSIRVADGPIIAPNLPGSNLLVGVEIAQDQIQAKDFTIEQDGKIFVIWSEVENFNPSDGSRRVFVVNRYTGEITFAPALRFTPDNEGVSNRETLLAEVPQAACEIRVWYRAGGGAEGNVRPGILENLEHSDGSLSVTNKQAAVGGSPAESLENAISRGPMSLHSLERAVTARDYEALAKKSSGGVNRARAIADAALWQHGVPGAVSIALIPNIQGSPSPVTREVLVRSSNDVILRQVQSGLDARRPLGTSCLVDWAHYKTVRVRANVLVYPGEEPAIIESRLLERLNALITPLTSGPDSLGWPFGKAISTWDIMSCIGKIAGVASVNNVRLLVDSAPNEDITTLERDHFQPDTCYTASGSTFYRSVNNGDSWEALHTFDGEKISLISAYSVEAGNDPRRAGLVSLITENDDTSKLFLSKDCGGSFVEIATFQFPVVDVAWIFRGLQPSVFLASSTGLYEVELREKAAPQQILFDESDPLTGANAVVVSTNPQGQSFVCVAGGGEAGIYLSIGAGTANSFKNVGLEGELARVLMVQHTKTQRFLWVGVSAAGRADGHGCFRIQLGNDGVDIDGWKSYADEWKAGTCRSLAHDGTSIYAGSLRRGVLRLEPDDEKPVWRMPDVSCGLPLRDVSRLHPIDALSAAPGVILAGGPTGVFRSADRGISYENCSRIEFENEVKLPRTWVFCSGEHEIEVRGYDETSGY